MSAIQPGRSGRNLGYARLSSQEQAAGTVTLEQQVERLRQAGATEVLTEVQSATKARLRPVYEELKRRVLVGEIDELVATRWDRICRSARETCEWVEILCAPGAPRLRLLDDPLGADLGSVSGRATLRIIGAVAQMETERLAERSAHGKRHRAQLARPDVTPFGMKLDGQGRPEPDDRPFLSTVGDHRCWSRAEIGQALFEHLEGGGTDYSGWTLLEAEWGIRWHRTAIARWAGNPALRGAYVTGREKNGAQNIWSVVREGAGRPLIDPDRHRAYAARQQERRRQGNRSHDTRRKHPLAGHVFCAHCERLMERSPHPQAATVYRCLRPDCAYRIPGKRRNSIGEAAAMEAVLDALGRRVGELALLIEGEAAADQQHPQRDAELTQLQAERDHLVVEVAAKPWLAASLPQLDRLIADRQLVLQSKLHQPDERLLELRAMFHGMSAALDPRLQAEVGQLVDKGLDPDQAAETILRRHRGDEVEAHTVQPVEGGLEALLVLPAEQWLTKGFRPLAQLTIDRFVRKITVIGKAVAGVELNL